MLMLNKNNRILQTFKMKEPQIMKQDIIMNEIYLNVHIHLFCKKRGKTIMYIVILRYSV